VRRSLLFWFALSWAAFVGLLTPFTGCSSAASMNPDSGTDEVPAQDSYDEGPDYCNIEAFKEAGGNGGPCSPIEPEKGCFGEPDSSYSCACVEGPKGTGIWMCMGDASTDKCPPMDADCFEGGFADTGPFDTGVEGGADAPSDAVAKDIIADVVHDATIDTTKDSP